MTDGERLGVPETAGRMSKAAAAFLAALAGRQRERACYPFGDERRDWPFLPTRERSGLPIGALDDGQRRLAHELILTGTSLPAYTKVVSVMAVEHVLRALNPAAADLFDPERYCFKLFGSPDDATWGWQFAGHHVSLNFTEIAGQHVSPRRVCWAPSPPRSACWRRWLTTRSWASGSCALSTPGSGERRSSTTARRPTWPRGPCRGSARPSGPTRCSGPSRTTSCPRRSATSSATSGTARRASPRPS